MNIRLLCSVIYLMVSMGEAMAIEEPVYDVIEQSKNIEIRQYRPFIIAETIVGVIWMRPLLQVLGV